MGKHTGTGAAIAAMLLLGGLAEAADVGRASLIVRGYSTTAIGITEWANAMHEVGTILGAAGIEVDWIDCSTDGAAAERCARPLKANEVAVRIVRAGTAHDPRVASLGESLLDSSRQSGTLATIYLDRVEWLARTANVPTTLVLARAIAHELGHLLLGAASHNVAGLMRAVWTRDELKRGRVRDWQFTGTDAARMLAGLARRAGVASLASADQATPGTI